MPTLRGNRISFVFATALAMLFLNGCGSGGLPQAEVSGKVTFQGKPVPDVLVSFTPERGPGALGKTDAEGNYTLMTKKSGDGAVIGHHVVTIKQPRQGVIMEKGKPPRMAPPPKQVIPLIFANTATSSLTADVEDGSNSFDFELGKR